MMTASDDFLNPAEDEFLVQVRQIKSYLLAHSEVNELILSGGEPLLLPQDFWEVVVDELLPLKSLKKWRWHTKLPIYKPNSWSNWENNLLPQILAKQEVTFVLHINHAREISSQTAEWVKTMSNLGANILAQGVLLKGVSDNPSHLVKLWESELELGIRPYYLHHLDRIKGGEQWRLSIPEGLKVFTVAERQMKANFKEFNLKYVLDLPSTFAKVEVRDLKRVTDGHYQFAQTNGRLGDYHDLATTTLAAGEVSNEKLAKN